MRQPFKRLFGSTRQDGPTAVLVVDVVSSTELCETIGDRAARDRIGARLEALSHIVRRQRGRVVKSLGDGLLCTLPSPAAGLAAATAMQRDRKHELAIRVGVHAGPVIQEQSDVFGDTVNTAARVASVCNPGEVLLSKAVVEALSPSERAGLRRVQPVTVKGKREPLVLYTLMTIEQGDVEQTLLSGSRGARKPTGLRLTLSLDDKSVVLDEERPSLSIGRDSANDLVVAHPRASRKHAVVTLRGDRLSIADRSANGTWVVPDGQPALVLRREEGLLTGSGCLHLGCEPATDDAKPVRYRLEQ
jgi:class 3 adenylate cyclase